MNSSELIAILILLVCVVAGLLLRSGTKDRSAPPPDDASEDPWTKPRRTAPAPSSRQPYTPAPAAPPPPPATLSGPAWVVDGDTLKIRNRPLRLFGIDAPETHHPYGDRATRALRRLCRGETVTAVLVGTDDYGRQVAKCHLSDGRDLSAEMVKLGLAIDWPKFSGGIYTALEVPGVRKKLWLADARQKGQMYKWDRFEAGRAARDAARAKGGSNVPEADPAAGDPLPQSVRSGDSSA